MGIESILLLGATGRTGKLALRYALSAGLAVTALARHPEKLAGFGNDRLRVLKGTPEDRAALSGALEGVDAVVSVLSNSTKSSQPYFMRDSMQNCLELMAEKGLRRIVVVTALGAGDSFQYLPWLVQFMARHTKFKMIFNDHDEQERVVRRSKLDWTIVRPPRLNNRRKAKNLIISYKNKPRPANSLSRRQLAKFIIDILEEPEYFGKDPVVSEK